MYMYLNQHFDDRKMWNFSDNLTNKNEQKSSLISSKIHDFWYLTQDVMIMCRVRIDFQVYVRIFMKIFVRPDFSQKNIEDHVKIKSCE